MPVVDRAEIPVNGVSTVGIEARKPADSDLVFRRAASLPTHFSDYSASSAGRFAAALRTRVFRTGCQAFSSSTPTWLAQLVLVLGLQLVRRYVAPLVVVLAVPLLDPRHDLVEAGEQRNDPLGTPAVPHRASGQQLEEGLRLVLVVPVPTGSGSPLGLSASSTGTSVNQLKNHSPRSSTKFLASLQVTEVAGPSRDI